MASISVCMIVKNEEKVLERCLLSLQGIWDELIIVDTGSSDKTKEIATRFTILNGLMILVRPGIMLFPRQSAIIFIRRMRTKYWMRRTESVSCS